MRKVRSGQCKLVIPASARLCTHCVDSLARLCKRIDGRACTNRFLAFGRDDSPVIIDAFREPTPDVSIGRPVIQGKTLLLTVSNLGDAPRDCGVRGY